MPHCVESSAPHFPPSYWINCVCICTLHTAPYLPPNISPIPTIHLPNSRCPLCVQPNMLDATPGLYDANYLHQLIVSTAWKDTGVNPPITPGIRLLPSDVALMNDTRMKK